MGQSAVVFMHGTGHVCGDCEDDLPYAGIVTLVQVVLPQHGQNGNLTVTPFFRHDGEYVYEPHFYHDGCWAKLQDGLFELLDDEGVAPHEDAYGICTCVMCESTIRAGEPTGMTQTGELQRSPRDPEGNGSVHFHAYSDMTQFFCLSCIRTVNDEIIEMWDHISYSGECPICTHERSWRTGAPCTHKEDE